MTNCCPRACSRLAAAAAFLAIGVVQIIAGMILLRSKYVYLLSGPNFWTASANIAVGSLLGVSATIWKTIDKKTKHSARRNLLAAMASSAIILNGTTAAILIMGESNSLLSIHLESRNSYGPRTSAKEILAYAYATSVCSPVICIVVSTAFLTGMCFRTKSAKKRSLDFKSILREDSTQDYSWVYTPQLTKPDPEVMKTTLSSSSESGLSSDDSDSYSSSISPVHIRSHTLMNKPGNIRIETSSNRSKFQNHIRKKDCLEAAVHSSCSKRGRVSFADESNSEKNRAVFVRAKFLNRYRSSSLGRRQMSALLTSEKARSGLPNRQMRSRVTPKVLFTEYPSGNTVHRSAILPYVRGEKFLSHTDDLPLPQLKMANSVDSAASCNANGKMRDLYIGHMSVDSPPVNEDAEPQSPDTEVDSVDEFRPHNHEKLQRTSTAEHSKVQKEIELLDDSAIHPDPIFDLRESCPNGNSHQIMNCVKNLSLKSSVLQNPADLEYTSCPVGEVVAAGVKNSNFRLKLPSKLIPVQTPVISDGHRYLITSNPISPGKYKRKLYSKSNKIYHNYNDCNQTGLSSFKGRRQADEVDPVGYTRKHNSSENKSPMESISEFPADEINDTFLPSTSTHTSGYVSTLEDESGDESGLDIALKQNNRQPSPSVHQEPTAEGTNSEKKSEHISKTNNYRQSMLSRSLRRSFQNVVEEFMKENPDIKSEEISHMLQASVV